MGNNAITLDVSADGTASELTAQETAIDAELGGTSAGEARAETEHLAEMQQAEGGKASGSESSGNDGGQGNNNNRPPRLPLNGPKPTFTAPLPSGVSGQVELGDLVGWGKGPTGTADSLARIGTLTPADIAAFRAANLTPDIAMQWSDDYSAQFAYDPNNPSAYGRSILMEWIAFLLQEGE